MQLPDYAPLRHMPHIWKEMCIRDSRDAGLPADMDHQRRSLKSQFKLADKLGARLVAVLGPDELAAGSVTLRDMQTHEERTVPLEDVPRMANA